ncbi:MAG: response regulator [Bdellovibrionaceae bacterium]|nr:response regulator [Pseudobdellovibrionaceae bacterium]
MNVYIVDDASFVRILCRHYVQKAGFNVVGEAYDGLTALEEITAKQPDCVIMDLALPSLNGADIMRNINQYFPQIQFIVVSALDKNFCNLQLNDVQFLRFITKPFSAEQVIEALTSAASQMEKQKHG